MKKAHLLYLAILIEGYVVLAFELLAIRQLIPFVGSGTETTAIIISAVLLPLAIGYHYGGMAFRKAYAHKKKTRERERVTIRKLLLRNILLSLVFLGFGFSYFIIEVVFFFLGKLGIQHHLMQTAVYVVLFLVGPMFWLGQTVPLVSQYFSTHRLGAITGRMLFFSTLGAFLGSLFSTLVLMSWVGVHNTVIVTIFLLASLGFLVAGKRSVRRAFAISLPILFFVWLFNNTAVMRSFGVISDNAYSQIRVQKIDGTDDKLLIVNRSGSAKLAQDPQQRFDYILYIESHLIESLAKQKKEPLNVLSLGAGGFSLGYYDAINHYTFVDIDKDIKDVVEKDFLKRPLMANKKFVAASARQFIHQDKGKYDLILIDVATNVISIPMEAVTREFWLDVKERLAPGGVVVSNTIAKTSFEDRFSRRYYNTFANVFRHVTRVPVDDVDPFTQEPVQFEMDRLTNMLTIYIDRQAADDDVIYTDDLNSYSQDMP